MKGILLVSISNSAILLVYVSAYLSISRMGLTDADLGKLIPTLLSSAVANCITLNVVLFKDLHLMSPKIEVQANAEGENLRLELSVTNRWERMLEIAEVTIAGFGIQNCESSDSLDLSETEGSQSDKTDQGRLEPSTVAKFSAARFALCFAPLDATSKDKLTGVSNRKRLDGILTYSFFGSTKKQRTRINFPNPFHER